MEKTRALIILGILLGCSSVLLTGCSIVGYGAGCFENRDRPAVPLFVVQFSKAAPAPVAAIPDSMAVDSAQNSGVSEQRRPGDKRDSSRTGISGAGLAISPLGARWGRPHSALEEKVGRFVGQSDSVPQNTSGVPLASNRIGANPDLQPHLIRQAADYKYKGSPEWIGLAIILATDVTVYAKSRH